MGMLAPVEKGTIFAGSEGARSGKTTHRVTAHRRRFSRRSLRLPSALSLRPGLTQDNQLVPGALNRSSRPEAQRALWLSRLNPMAGPWLLTAYPRPSWAGEPRRIATRVSVDPIGRSMSRNRRLSARPRSMVKRPEKSVECDTELLPRPRARGSKRLGCLQTGENGPLLSRRWGRSWANATEASYVRAKARSAYEPEALVARSTARPQSPR